VGRQDSRSRTELHFSLVSCITRSDMLTRKRDPSKRRENSNYESTFTELATRNLIML